MSEEKTKSEEKKKSSDLHINRNRAISQILREDREERRITKLIAENRKLKSELAEIKAAQTAQSGDAAQSGGNG